MSRRTMIDELRAKGWRVVKHGSWYYIIAPGSDRIGGMSWATESEAWDRVERFSTGAQMLVDLVRENEAD